MLFLISACKDEGPDQYDGLSKLVAERQNIRENISKENALKKAGAKSRGQEGDSQELTDNSPDPGLSRIVYEKQVEILDSESRRPLAKGIAYLNKSGRIVRIRVLQN